MSSDDLEINLIQVPNKDNPKQTKLKQKKLKFKKSKQISLTQTIQTRSKNQDDDVIIIGFSKPNKIPLSKKTISKRRIKQQKKHTRLCKSKEIKKNSTIQDLILDWQKNIKQMIESTILLSNKISQMN